MSMASQDSMNPAQMPSDTVPPNPPLRLDIPRPQFQSIIPSDYGESESEETHLDAALPEENAHAVMGVSIGREQSRLMSPRTPAAEKTAAMEHRGGMFDGVGEEDSTEEEVASQSGAPEASDTREPLPSNQELPSPWTATPKFFEKTDMGDQSYLIRKPWVSSGPTGMLADLNVRRFLSSFNLPSLPRTSSLKDFSIPSISSMLGGNKERSPQRKAGARQKRANTVSVSRSTYNNDSQLSKCGNQNVVRGRPSGSPQSPAIGAQAAGFIPARREITRTSSQYTLESGRLAAPQAPRDHMLRRSTSDQSLLLRRVTSSATSLGDDSRWEHVQDQVNSRFKAVIDSLQDSSIKIPSLPSLPNLHFHGFRPEFMRSRANSDEKQPTHSRDGNANASLSTRDVDGPRSASQQHSTTHDLRNVRNPSKAEASYLDQALEELTGDIIIMGGYRGSVLRSARPPHSQQWVPIKVGLNIRKVNLEVGLEPEDEVNMQSSIVPSGMLTHIGPVDMGRRLIKRLRHCKNAQEGRLRVFDYGYDWRLSPALLSRRLIEILKMLPSNAASVPRHERGATVLAHSMGGLITRHAVNQRPDLFAGVVYAGVPQHCINILGPLRNGDEVLLSSKVLTAQVNFTFRTTFVLLPDNGKCFVDRETKEEYPVDFFNVESYREHSLSPCIAPALPPLQPEKKGLLGSVTESLTSLPLPGRKASTSVSSTRDRPDDPKQGLSDVVNTAAIKLDDMANATGNVMEPQPNTHYNPHPPNSISTRSTIPLPKAIQYLERTLSETLEFKRALAFNPAHSSQNLYPPLAVLYSTSVPTVVAARVSSREAIKHADAYDDLAFASGDGVCLAKAAMLPEGYRCVRRGRVRTERGHVGLLGDLEAVGQCLLAVLEGRRREVGLGVGTDERGIRVKEG